MKKVSLSVASRAYASNRPVMFATGEAIQAGCAISIKAARKKLLRCCYYFNAPREFYVRE